MLNCFVQRVKGMNFFLIVHQKSPIFFIFWVNMHFWRCFWGRCQPFFSCLLFCLDQFDVVYQALGHGFAHCVESERRLAASY